MLGTTQWGATLKFHTSKEFLCVYMSLGRENGFYETASFMLRVKGKNEAPKAIFTNSAVYVNNKKVSFRAYNIGGNNYFKLRDVCKFFDIGVIWDGDLNRIRIDTSIQYTE